MCTKTNLDNGLGAHAGLSNVHNSNFPNAPNFPKVLHGALWPNLNFSH